jgi:NADH:ubiquinone oxidoreductase subunit 4 (subunit M)
MKKRNLYFSYLHQYPEDKSIFVSCDTLFVFYHWELVYLLGFICVFGICIKKHAHQSGKSFLIVGIVSISRYIPYLQIYFGCCKSFIVGPFNSDFHK